MDRKIDKERESEERRTGERREREKVEAKAYIIVVALKYSLLLVDIPSWWWILQQMVDTLTYLDVFMLNLWILPAGGGYYYSSWCYTISAGAVYFLLWCIFPVVCVYSPRWLYFQLLVDIPFWK
jgi:hypothetical protein